MAAADPATAAAVATKATHRDVGRDTSSGSCCERRRSGDSNSGCCCSSDSGSYAGSDSGDGGVHDNSRSTGRDHKSGSDCGSGGWRGSANGGTRDVLCYVGGGEGCATAAKR